MDETERISAEMDFIEANHTASITDLMKAFNISAETAEADVYTIFKTKLKTGVSSFFDQDAASKPDFSDMFGPHAPADGTDSTPTMPDAQATEIMDSLIDKMGLTPTATAINSAVGDAASSDALATEPIPEQLTQLLAVGFQQPQLRIRYQKIDEDYATWHEIIVMRIYPQNTHWYIEAYDLGRQAMRTFRIDRVRTVAVLQDFDED